MTNVHVGVLPIFRKHNQETFANGFHKYSTIIATQT